MIAFTVPGDPLPTARPRVVRAGKGMRAFTPQATSDYQTTVAFHARLAMFQRARGVFPLRDPVRVDVTFYRRTQRRCDIDNLIKSILDGLTKAGAWEDDSQVVELHAVKAQSANEPRTEVVLGLLAEGA